MGVDNKGLDKIVGISLKNQKAVEQIASASIAPIAPSQGESFSINAIRALDLTAKNALGANYMDFSGKKPMDRSTGEVLSNIAFNLSGNKSKEGYPQDIKTSLNGIDSHVRQKEDALASAVGYKPQRSSNLSGDALVNNLTDRLSQVTRMMSAYKDIAKFNMPGTGLV
jgi:hypothetical protein